MQPPMHWLKFTVLQKSQYKWMKNTQFKNTVLMHMQERNVHGKIFGGYLMKVAYELAWSTAVTFFGVPAVTFAAVDDIQFVKVGGYY
jgi:acyl-coenzyme A thioesterase 9